MDLNRIVQDAAHAARQARGMRNAFVQPEPLRPMKHVDGCPHSDLWGESCAYCASLLLRQCERGGANVLISWLRARP